MINSDEIQLIIQLLKKCHINQLLAIFHYIIDVVIKNKLSSKEYIQFLKSINRL